MNDGSGAVVALEAAESKQSGDLALDVRGRRASVKSIRVLNFNPVGRRHRRQQQNGGDDSGHQARH